MILILFSKELSETKILSAFVTNKAPPFEKAELFINLVFEI